VCVDRRPINTRHHLSDDWWHQQRDRQTDMQRYRQRDTKRHGQRDGQRDVSVVVVWWMAAISTHQLTSETLQHRPLLLTYVHLFLSLCLSLFSLSQFVCMGSYSSVVTSCCVGVPQGSVLGLLLFFAYTSSLSTVAESHHVFQQQYTDDTQLYVSLHHLTIMANSAHSSHVLDLFMSGSARMVWYLTQPNQMLYSLAHLSG